MSVSKRVLIVGGVAGGASAAARARRLSESAEIILFERGDYISFANCGLPYYIGGEIKNRDRLLVQTPERMRSRFNIDVRTNAEVVKIDRNNKTIEIQDKVKDKKYSEHYDELVLSPGASAIKPPIPGIENQRVFTLRNMTDMDAIHNFITTAKVQTTTVIGGGYIGLEMVEALRHRGVMVTVVELADQVMGPIDREMASLLHDELCAHGVDLRLGVSVTAINTNQNILDIKLSNGDNILSDMIILAIGVRPEINLAKNAGLEIGKLGGIIVDQQMRTNDPNIYAVGDAIEVKESVSGKSVLIPLAGPANRQGRIAADNIFGRNSTYRSTQGTGVCKVFAQTVAMTGLNEKMLKRFEIPYQKIYLHANNHAGYYPGATQITLKLLFAANDGRILGAQAIGVAGVDKRIDVLAMAIRKGFTVFDLEESELCYAPPYGSAKDIINYAGFVATNVLQGDSEIIHADEIADLDSSKQLLLDVRTKEEVECGTIPQAINIPLDELRQRMVEIPQDKELIVFCKVGLRGYLAERILRQHGYSVKNLSGGYTTYKMFQQKVGEVKIATTQSSSAVKVDKNIKVIDACGLQCPGPIQRLKHELDLLADGEVISIATSDPGFIADAPAWCAATGNEFINTVREADNTYLTKIRKGKTSIAKGQLTESNNNKKMTIVLFSGDLDKAIAAFIIANGALAMGYEVTLFATFWGLNVLRRDELVNVKKSFIQKMMGKMMPRGAKKVALSKMHMLGMGTAMIKHIMQSKNVNSLPELITSAKKGGAHLVGCSMTMELMGITSKELIDGVEQGGVAMYLEQAGQGNINLFI